MKIGIKEKTTRELMNKTKATKLDLPNLQAQAPSKNVASQQGLKLQADKLQRKTFSENKIKK